MHSVCMRDIDDTCDARSEQSVSLCWPLSRSWGVVGVRSGKTVRRGMDTSRAVLVSVLWTGGEEAVRAVAGKINKTK